LPLRKIFILFAAAAALTTAACNTVSGVGRDATAAGQAVTGAAEDAKH
jgi:predicted small secreted protein